MATSRSVRNARSVTPLQDEILRAATDVIGPNVAARIVSRKFAEAGVLLTAAERRELHRLIVQGRLNQFAPKRQRRSVAVVTFTAADGEALTVEATNRMRAMFDRELKRTDRYAADLLRALHDKWPGEHARQHREMVGFRRRLRQRWREPFSLFRMFMTVYRETGQVLANALIGTTANGRPSTATVLIELHARSCQVLYEVITLIEGGFADGAMARARTLHEIAVTAMFLQQGDEELTRRYLDHEVVESWKAVQKHVRYEERIAERPPSQKAQDTLRARHEALMAKYKKPFGGQYGWAAAALNKDRPSFADIELATNVDHLRPYYQLASHPVHANPKGLHFKLGAFRRRGRLALATNHGFALPASSAIVAAIQTISALMMMAPSVDAMVNVKVIQQLSKQLETAFVRTQRSEVKRFRQFDREAAKPTK
jgi:hypothetical protein